MRVQKSQATHILQRKPSVVHNPLSEDEDDQEQSMDIEETADPEDPSMMTGTQEVEGMIDLDDSEDEGEQNEVHPISRDGVWPAVSPERAERYKQEVEAIREVFEDEQDMFDTTMVSEYAEEIFQYMTELEV
jgi:G2/mitotic-specific cyclin 2